MFQSPAVKVSAVEAAGAPAPEDSFPSPSSALATVTVTAPVGWVASFTVKVAVAPSSAVSHRPSAAPGSAGSSTRAASSSSVMVRVRAGGFAAPLDTPDTLTLFPATEPSTIESISSSTAATVTVPALAVFPAAMVSVVPDSVKSSAAAFVPGAADTVTVIGVPSAAARCAVTVATPPDSEIDALDSAIVRLVGVPVASADAAPSGAPARLEITRTVYSLPAWSPVIVYVVEALPLTVACRVAGA